MRLADIFAIVADAQAEGRPFADVLAQAGNAAVAFAMFYPHGRRELPSGTLPYETKKEPASGFAVLVLADGERCVYTWGTWPTDSTGVTMSPGKLYPGGYFKRDHSVQPIEPQTWYRVRIPITESEINIRVTTDYGVGAGGEAARVATEHALNAIDDA